MDSYSANDLAIADLAAEVVSLREERDSYRALALNAMHLLHDQHLEHEHLRDQHHRLLEEFRTARAELRRYMAATVIGRAA